jgi:hypothetical protein
MQPILPLVPDRFETDSKDKTTYITFDLKVRAGTGEGTPSYKKHMQTLDNGTPQEWMESLAGLREIWQQNGVSLVMSGQSRFTRFPSGPAPTQNRRARTLPFVLGEALSPTM